MERVTKSDIRENIRFCLKKIKGEGFNVEHHLISGEFLSSFDMVELLIELECVFQIEIPRRDITPDNFDDLDIIEKIVVKEIDNREKKETAETLGNLI